MKRFLLFSILLLSFVALSQTQGGCTKLLTFDELYCSASGSTSIPAAGYQGFNIPFSCIHTANYSKIYNNMTGFGNAVSPPNAAYKAVGTYTMKKTDGSLFDFVDGCFGDVFLKHGTRVVLKGFEGDTLATAVETKNLTFYPDCHAFQYIQPKWRNLRKVTFLIQDFNKTHAALCGPSTRSNFVTMDNLCVEGDVQSSTEYNPCPVNPTVLGDADIPPEITTQTHITTMPLSTAPLTTSFLTTNEMTTNELTTNELTTRFLTTKPLTTKPLTTARITSARLTTSPISTQALTTSVLTTSALTTQDPTTAPLTTSPLTTNDFTTGAITSSEITTSPVTSAVLTTSPRVTTKSITSASLTTKSITSGSISTGLYIDEPTCSEFLGCSDQGECLDGHCSCYSGFGGDSACSQKPSGECDFANLNQDSALFSPDLEISVENSVVNIDIRIPLEQPKYLNPSIDHTEIEDDVYSLATTIKFVGASNNSELCNYPNGPIFGQYQWDKPAAFTIRRNKRYSSDDFCTDLYTFTLPWSVFRSSCSLVATGGNTFTQIIHVERNYYVPFIDGPFIRTESMQRNIEFRFPSSVDINTAMVVLSPSFVTVSAVVKVEYNIQDDEWNIVVLTNTITPYRLYDPEVEASSNSVQNRISSAAIEQSNTGAQAQRITIKSHSCNAINSDITIVVRADCLEGSECILANRNKSVTLQAHVETGNACPFVHTIALSDTSISSYSDASLTESSVIFTSDAPAYFKVNVDSEEAHITSRVIESVCIAFNSGNCTDVQFSVISAPGVETPSFSVDLSSLSGFAEEGDFATVKAHVQIEWEETANKKKRSVIDERAAINSMEVDINANFLIKAGQEVAKAKSSANGINAIFSLILSIALLFFLF